MKPFLTADWRRLVNITYKVDPQLLQHHVPPGITLDVQDGYAFASIVAFEFLDTRVKGLKIPFHVNFPEINLRYYLKEGDKRGVAFIKELVPKHCIALIANRVYNEPYEAVPMKCGVDKGEKMRIWHEFRYGGKTHKIEAIAGKNLGIPAEDTVSHYFKEHDTGYGKTKKGELLRYEVAHPAWEIYELESYMLEMDFGLIYGQEWDILHEAEVHCALVAEGSEIAVYPKEEG